MFLEWFAENNLKVEESVGIDEVGRGPLAGPVISAAVWISKKAAEELESLNSKMPVRDSKKLSHLQRQNVVEWLRNQSQNDVLYGIGEASVAEIDKINIRNAAFLSMKRAYEALWRSDEGKTTETMTSSKSCENTGFSGTSGKRLEKIRTILVDGNAVPSDLSAHGSENNHKTIETDSIRYPEDIRAIVKGDSKVLNISMASIIAKEFRDDIMRKLALEYPEYSWSSNVGYGTKEHLEAIKNCGITEHHRRSFAPIKTMAV